MTQAALAREITYIPPVPQQANTMAQRWKKRVAGYARVSTKEDEQQNSYDAQVSYFTEYIQSREEWEFVDVYTDKGISGTSLKHRDGFNQMIQDALDGKIDLIVLKSISRFARNTVDALSTIRLLKARGVGIYFEKESINSLDDNSEMIITFLSSLAQEESHSISKNVTWGIRNSFSNGKVWMPYKHFLGYEKGEDGLPSIIESEAKIIRLIYWLFVKGRTENGIAEALEVRGIPSPSGKKTWPPSTIHSILTNEKYKGAALLQKSFTTNFLTKEKKANSGEVQQYYIAQSHHAIIPPEVFDLVQIEMDKRKRDKRRRNSVSIFSNKLVCSECGNFYGRRVWHSNSQYRRTIWQCGHKFQNGKKCTTPHFYEEEIQDAFIAVMNRMILNREEIIAALEAAIAKLSDLSGIESKIAAAERDANAVAFEMRQAIENNTRQAQDQQQYAQKYEEMASKWTAAKEALQRLTDIRTQHQSKTLQIKSCLDLFRGREELLTAFDEKLWVGVVEEVMVFPDGKMEFGFKDGSKALS